VEVQELLLEGFWGGSSSNAAVFNRASENMIGIFPKALVGKASTVNFVIKGL
jgi:hypothetical protein